MTDPTDPSDRSDQAAPKRERAANQSPPSPSASGAFPYGPTAWVGIPNVVARNTDIWPRSTSDSGQKLPPPQPAVIPLAATWLIQPQKGLDCDTSANDDGGQAAGGKPRATIRKTDICERVMVPSGQKTPAAQPLVIPSRAIS